MRARQPGAALPTWPAAGWFSYALPKVKKQPRRTRGEADRRLRLLNWPRFSFFFSGPRPITRSGEQPGAAVPTWSAAGWFSYACRKSRSNHGGHGGTRGEADRRLRLLNWPRFSFFFSGPRPITRSGQQPRAAVPTWLAAGWLSYALPKVKKQPRRARRNTG